MVSVCKKYVWIGLVATLALLGCEGEISLRDDSASTDPGEDTDPILEETSSELDTDTGQYLVPQDTGLPDPNDPDNDPFEPKADEWAEGFTGGSLPPGWISIDGDGATPGPSWPYHGWEVVSQSDCHGCQPGCAISTSAYMPAAKADDWLITPPIELHEHSTITWSGETLWGLNRDGFEVRISTDKPVIEDFLKNDPLFSLQFEQHYGMNAHRINLDEFGYANQTVYVAIRNNTFNGSILCVGFFKVQHYEESSDYYDYLITDEACAPDMAGIDPPEPEPDTDTAGTAAPMESCATATKLSLNGTDLNEVKLNGDDFYLIYRDNHHWREETTLIPPEPDSDSDFDTEQDSDSGTLVFDEHEGCDSKVEYDAPEIVFEVTIEPGQKLVMEEHGTLTHVFRIIDSGGELCDATTARCLVDKSHNKTDYLVFNTPGTYWAVIESWHDHVNYAHRTYDLRIGVYEASESDCLDGLDNDGDGLTDCIDEECLASCGTQNLATFPKESFDNGIPEEWTIGTCNRADSWKSCDGSGFGMCYPYGVSDTNHTGGTGPFAVASDSFETSMTHERLDTPPIDISGVQNGLALRFKQYFPYTGNWSTTTGHVFVSPDGTDWTFLKKWSYATAGASTETFGLTNIVGDSDELYIRFEYQDGLGWTGDGIGDQWEIDDVEILTW